MPITGRIIEEQKNYYIVDTPHGAVRAATRGLLKNERKRLCVGDSIECEVTNSDTAEGVITKVNDRTTFLSRPALANLSQVILVCTIKEPPLDLEAADRFLVCVSAYGLAPLLAFNKHDRLTPQELETLSSTMEVYRRCGYIVLMTSAVTGEGVGELLGLCAGQVSAFAGPSGVGKSALLQRIFPDRRFRIGDVSGPSGRGTHTTTCVTLLPLANGGYIADTPGLSFVDLPLLPEEDIAGYFPELEAQTGRCRFNNCVHDSEPGCRVRELIDKGEIAPWRVEHYLKIRSEMKTRRRRYRERA